ncbi:MAG: response regulator, partial [Myxococcota bacterium]
MKKTRVLIVDDSALVRKLLERILTADPEIEVVGTASDAYVARDILVQERPDVMTLDVEMPKMDGVTFLRRIMAKLPTPVVMMSVLTEQGTEVSLEALKAGAIEVLAKPDNLIQGMTHMAPQI